MHDKFTGFVAGVMRFITRRKGQPVHSSRWDYDAHNQAHSLSQWIKIAEDCGFKLLRSRASTLFPPLP